MINIPALVALVVFYIVILIIGLFAARKRNAKSESQEDEAIVAGRSLGLLVGVFSCTATWVGGGYINGTAENVFNPAYGLVWTQAPVGYGISLILGGLIFAKKMRAAEYTTMLDPLQEAYGRYMSALLFIPCCLGDLFWTAMILSALGGTVSVIMDFDVNWSIIISAAVAVVYTEIGGMYSVAYTDVVQLVFIFVCLWIAVPFSLLHPSVQSLAQTARTRTFNGTELSSGWLGQVAAEDGWYYADLALLLIFGGIPWQVYFQRVLSQKTANGAVAISLISGVAVVLLAVAPATIGAVAASANWRNTTLGNDLTEPAQMRYVLPLVMQHLCPLPVSIVGLGAVAAAVMSSADSAILSSASLFSRNVVKQAFWPSVPDAVLVWIIRASVLVMGVCSTVIAILVQSLYGLWYLCSDLVYVCVFAQLLCSLYLPQRNAYGSLAAFFVSAALRVTAGESLMSLPPLIRWPGFVEGEQFYQRFPIRTFSMMAGLVTLVLVSIITHLLFTKGILPESLDVFDCVGRRNGRRGSNGCNEYRIDSMDAADKTKSWSFDSFAASSNVGCEGPQSESEPRLTAITHSDVM